VVLNVAPARKKEERKEAKEVVFERQRQVFINQSRLAVNTGHTPPPAKQFLGSSNFCSNGSDT